LKTEFLRHWRGITLIKKPTKKKIQKKNSCKGQKRKQKMLSKSVRYNPLIGLAYPIITKLFKLCVRKSKTHLSNIENNKKRKD